MRKDPSTSTGEQPFCRGHAPCKQPFDEGNFIHGTHLIGCIRSADHPCSSFSTNTHRTPTQPLGIYRTITGTRNGKNQNGISSAVGGGFGSSWVADVVDDIWVLTGVTTGVSVVVEAEVEATMGLGVGMGISEAGAGAGGGGFGVRMGGGGGLFITCHFMRSRVATESSTEEWPTLAPPVWIALPRCSLTLRKVNKIVPHEGNPVVGGRDVQISQCPSIWWSSRMPEYDGGINIPEVNHPQRLEIVLQSVSY